MKRVLLLAAVLVAPGVVDATEVNIEGASVKFPGGWIVIQSTKDFMFGNAEIDYKCHALTTQKDIILDVSTLPERGVSHIWTMDFKKEGLPDRTGEWLDAKLEINGHQYKTNIAIQRFNTLRLAAFRDQDISTLATEMKKGGLLTVTTKDGSFSIQIHDFMAGNMKKMFAYCLQQDITSPAQWYSVPPDGEIKIYR